MKRKILIEKSKNKIRTYLIEDDDIVEIHTSINEEQVPPGKLGDIYIGKVQNIVQNIGAAFIEITKGVNCYFDLKDAENAYFTHKSGKKPLCIGDELVVQISREAVKTKAPTVTSHLSFTGRYAVLTHGNTRIGVSSKIPRALRDEFKDRLSRMKNEQFGIIIRTNAKGVPFQEVEDEIERLKEEYKKLLNTALSRVAFSRLKSAPPTYISDLKNVYMEGMEEIVIEGKDLYTEIQEYFLTEFPEKVLNQAVRVGKEVSEADMAGRMDLRDWQMVTIDGEDAKDLDDAVSVERDGENYVLGVHIADVTNYVQEKSALDREALERGTSVYLADRVIPMLPHILSNGVCSLNAGEERLALSCIMTISPKGEMISHEITESVICVDKRMSYNKVSAVLEQDEQALREYEGFVPMIWMMKELSELIRQKRGKRGAIDFDFPETKIVLDEDGKPIEVKPYDRNPATEIIEDFMLMANETVAEEFFWREIPFLYRTHEAPDEDRIRQLSAFVNSFGYHIHVGNEIRPKEIQKLLEKVEGKPEEDLISRLTLRSMKQARYTTENTGHFGLAAKYYTHFTSPIRRYPDLQIHRIIKENLRGRFDENRAEHYSELLQQVAAQCSERERRAEEAEREVVKLKKAEYMRDHIGEEFDGVISGVTKWGAYVELENTVEGLAHVADMWDDHYEFYEQSYELVGEHTGKTYKPGQKVRICVTDADKLQRTVNFRIL